MKNKKAIIILVVVLIIVIIFWSQVKSFLIQLGLLPMADVKQIYPLLHKWEGHISNNPADHGGYTNAGITIGTWQNLAPKLLGISGTIDTLNAMTEAQWQTIVNHFWNTVHASEIQNQGVANLLFQSYWGSNWYGPQRMIIAFNKKYGTNFNVSISKPIITPEVIKAINSKNGYEVCQLFWSARKEHFEAIVAADPSQKVWLNGWLNRLNDYKCKQAII